MAQKSRDKFIGYLIVVVVVALAGIAAFVWTHTRKSDYSDAPDVAYAKMGPYQVEAQHYTIVASLDVQTDSSDDGWAKDNKKALDSVFRTLLAENVDADTMKSPAGLKKLEDILAKGTNQALGTNRVQAVLLTNFNLQTRDQPSGE